MRQGSLEDAYDWELPLDLGGKLVIPQEIASIKLGSDVVFVV